MTSTRRFDPAKALVGLASAAVPAAVAVALRNHYDWEDTAAILALVGAYAAAALLAGAAAALWDRRLSTTVTWAHGGAAAVIPLLVLYYLVLMFTTADYS